MKISYIGSGYVGQVNAAAAAKFGHQVILVDVVPEIVEKINKGIPTIYEDGLDDLLHDLVINKKNLKASLNIEQAILDTEVSFICVGTPDKANMIDLSYIRDVSIEIGKALKKKDDFHLVVVKSTVVPGTTLSKVLPQIEKYSGKKSGVDFGISMNPEFLREGIALEDAINPDSVVIGTQKEDKKTRERLKSLYSWVDDPKFTFTGISEAEAIKYAKNTFLAMKITFANQWANFCDTIGIDAKQILDAIGVDKRISPMFLRNGPGYGGSCFPKDVNAIVHEGIVKNTPFTILEEVVQANNTQYLKLIELAQNIVGDIQEKKVGVLGLSFKPNTDDTRESPALRLIAYLTSLNCEIKAYCPQGIEHAKKWLVSNRITDITYTTSSKKCVENMDLVFIPTDWEEFKEIIPNIKVPVFIGHRSLVDPSKFENVYALGHPRFS